jgi:endonuclease III
VIDNLISFFTLGSKSMERRVTRSAARADLVGDSPAQVATTSKALKPSKVSKTRVNKAAAIKNTTVKHPGPKSSLSKTRLEAIPKLESSDELPHNLGTLPISPAVKESFIAGSDKENTSVKEEKVDRLTVELQDTVDKATATVEDNNAKTTPPARKPKKNTYGLTPGTSPFPEWAQPSTEECEEVNRLLSTVHGKIAPPATIPEPSLTVTGCGEVPSVLDALIRTLLSGATTGANSARAFNGLVQRFGILTEGIGKGSVNWEAVRQATLKDVFEAIKSGGLADVKSKNLKGILDMVHEDNQTRRNEVLTTKAHATTTFNHPDLETEEKKAYEIACADQNVLSLNHFHGLTSEQAMTELVKYPGIGPKTAACVILFCLQRPCFAVDTHIFRICKWLGWVPPRANEVTAFSHLEVRIPDHLKYSLHQLFIRHGKSCPRCRAITGASSAGWEDGCVIDHLVTRTGKRKGLAVAAKGKGKVKAKRKVHTGTRKRQESDGEMDSESLSGTESDLSDLTDD